jgi:hypothetical protein
MNNNNHPAIISVRYKTANLYKGERMLHLQDQQYRTADTPDRETCLNDIVVYRDQDRAVQINKSQSSVIVPNRVDLTETIAEKKGRDNLPVSIRDVKARKHMQVSQRVFTHAWDRDIEFGCHYRGCYVFDGSHSPDIGHSSNICTSDHG